MPFFFPLRFDIYTLFKINQLFTLRLRCRFFRAFFMPSRKSSSSMAIMKLFMLGVLCRAFSAEWKKSESDYNAAFFITFFMPAEKAGDQNILNAGRKSWRFLPRFFCPAFSVSVLIVIALGIKQKTPSFLC